MGRFLLGSKGIITCLLSFSISEGGLPDFLPGPSYPGGSFGLVREKIKECFRGYFVPLENKYIPLLPS